MSDEYLIVADPAELAKTERALWEAHRLAMLQELMQLYPGKGWHLGMQSIDRSLDGTPSPKQYTVALVAPIVDSAQPGGLILIDQHVLALQGVAVDVKVGDKPERVAIDVSAKLERAALPAAWQAVLTKREQPLPAQTKSDEAPPVTPPESMRSMPTVRPVSRVASVAAYSAAAFGAVAGGAHAFGAADTWSVASGFVAAALAASVALLLTKEANGRPG